VWRTNLTLEGESGEEINIANVVEELAGRDLADLKSSG
jgi:hypothetical protein